MKNPRLCRGGPIASRTLGGGLTFRQSEFYTTNVVVVNLHRLLGVLAPLHVLFVYHDILDGQPQQLRCQLLDVRVPLCQGDKVVCAAPQRPGNVLPFSPTAFPAVRPGR